MKRAKKQHYKQEDWEYALCFEHLVDGLEQLIEILSKKIKRLSEQVTIEAIPREEITRSNIVKRRFLCRATGLRLMEAFYKECAEGHG